MSYVDFWSREKFTEVADVFICCLGYEERAAFVARSGEVQAGRRVAIGFDYGKELAYQSNQEWYRENGFEVFEWSDREFEAGIRSLGPFEAARVVVIDVSSFSRFRIAALLAWLCDLPDSQIWTIHVVYAVAEFSEPNMAPQPVLDTSPIHPYFAGWPTDPGKPLSCVVGLGYEEGKAIGAIEFLEAGPVWLFRPQGWDSRFVEWVDKANEDLLAQVPAARVLDYSLENPLYCFRQLESLVKGLCNGGRVALLPFGPKIFAVLSLLVALQHREDVSVWRVSAGALEKPVRRQAFGSISGVTLVLATNRC